MAKNRKTKLRKTAAKSKRGVFSRFGRLPQKQITLPIFLLLFALVAGIVISAFAEVTRYSVYSIICPLDGTSIPYTPQSGQQFGAPRSYGGHTGLDFGQAQGGGAYSGAPVRASKSGKIVKTSVGSYNSGYGNTVWLLANEGATNEVQFRYNHLSSVNVSTGQTVTAGHVVGGVGDTGSASGVHLHMDIRPGGGDPIDPLPSINKPCQKYGSNPQPSTNTISIVKTDPRAVYSMRLYVSFKIDGQLHYDWEDVSGFSSTRNLIIDARGMSWDGSKWVGDMLRTQSVVGGSTIYVRKVDPRAITELKLATNFYVDEAKHYDYYTYGSWTSSRSLQLDARGGHWDSTDRRWEGDFLRRR